MHNLSPVSFLPIELLVLIFEAACFEPRSSPSTNTEVTISHVCRFWRTISLSCPQLWTSFKFDGWTLRKAIHQCHVDAYIKRSERLLLDFSFEVSAFMGLLEVAQCALVPHAFRFRRLVFCISDSGEYSLAVLKLFEFLFMENLEIFEIQLKGTDSVGDMMLKKFYFKGCAPRLKAYRTDNRLLHIFHMPQVIAHSNITDIQLDAASPLFFVDWRRFSRFSVAASTLVTLSISAAVFNYPTRLDLQMISLPNLRYLWCRDDAIGRFMSHFLHAPLLEQLILHDQNIGWWAKTSGRTTAPVNIFPRIKMVAFINCEIYHRRNATLFRLAQATQSATHLIVSHSNSLNTSSMTGIAGYLVGAEKEAEPMLWQHLEVLSCLDQVMSRDMYVHYLNVMTYRASCPGIKAGKLRVLELHVNNYQGEIREVGGEEIVEAIRHGEESEGILPWPDKDLFHRSAQEQLCRGWF